MTYFYDNGSVYNDAVETVPNTAKEISVSTYMQMQSYLSDGFKIELGEDGKVKKPYDSEIGIVPQQPIIQTIQNNTTVYIKQYQYSIYSEDNNSLTQPSQFKNNPIGNIVGIDSLNWSFDGNKSVMFETIVKSSVDQFIDAFLEYVDNNAYIYINDVLYISSIGSGFKDLNLQIPLIAGNNKIQIIINNIDNSVGKITYYMQIMNNNNISAI